MVRLDWITAETGIWHEIFQDPSPVPCEILFDGIVPLNSEGLEGKRKNEEISFDLIFCFELLIRSNVQEIYFYTNNLTKSFQTYTWKSKYIYIYI